MIHRVLMAALLFGIVSVPRDAAAATCDKIASYVDAAKSQLRGAALVTDLPNAKRLAREAGKSLEDAASAAKECGCEVAHATFDDAAARAKLAANADSVKEHLTNLGQAIRGLTAGVDELAVCTHKTP